MRQMLPMRQETLSDPAHDPHKVYSIFSTSTCFFVLNSVHSVQMRQRENCESTGQYAYKEIALIAPRNK